MKRPEYFELREKMYKVAGEVGTVAEKYKSVYLHQAYDKICEGLDCIDEMGFNNEYLDEYNNEIEGE